MNLENLKEDFEREANQVKGVLFMGKPIGSLPNDLLVRVRFILANELGSLYQEIKQINYDIQSVRRRQHEKGN